ncbi:hypothetical protein [Yoonia sp. R2-816]|uniref:hypothetical protein n=1 Tax=Yoonia sp. R2-816 TaxID=3342638 RepID=UPI003729200A
MSDKKKAQDAKTAGERGELANRATDKFSRLDPIGHDATDSGDAAESDVGDSYDGFIPNIAATTTFTAEDAQARNGNYVLSLGLGGSGKSTFHSFLLRYIEQSGKLDFEMKIPRLRSGEEDHQTRNLLNQWRSKWSRGEFVLPTAASEAAIREINYSVVPSQGIKVPLDFGLIEVSGELLKQVQGGRTGRQSLPEAVHHLIANPRVNLVVLMMVHPDTPNNDILLTNFIDYVNQNFQERRSQISLGVIIANPDRALEQMISQTGGDDASPFSHYQRLEDQAVIDYMRTMAPGIMAKWVAWPERDRMLVPMRLGDIDFVVNPNQKGAMIPRLVAPDFTDVEKVFDWLYHRFTGKRRGPTFFQRLFNSIDKAN